MELIGVTDGVVRLRMQGSCKSCPSSAMTLKLAIEEAIYAAAPDVVAIEAEGVTRTAVRHRLCANWKINSVKRQWRANMPTTAMVMESGGAWEEVSGLSTLGPAAVFGWKYAGVQYFSAGWENHSTHMTTTARDAAVFEGCAS